MHTIQSLSEINFGLILADKKSIHEYLPDYFAPPYDSAIDYMKSDPNWTIEILASKYLSPSALRSARFASDGTDELDDLDWLEMLKEKMKETKIGHVLERAGKQLIKGKGADLLQIAGQLKVAADGEDSGLSLVSEIDTSDYTPFVSTGYTPLDDILGGIPTDSPVIIFGATGVGKSQFIANLSICLLKEHPEWKGAMFTLEMGAKHWAWRTKRSYPDIKEVEDRLYISSDVRDIDELEAKVASLGADFVVIDDIDGIVREVSAIGHEDVYMKTKRICRLLGIPVFIIAQAKPASLAANRFLTEHDVNWSGAGHKVAGLMIALQIADEFDIEGEDGYQTWSELHEYIIVTKSRDGYPKMQGGGAIILEHDPNSFWTGDYIAKKFFKKGKRTPLKRK